jgi:secreted trypsin-like serine protease
MNRRALFALLPLLIPACIAPSAAPDAVGEAAAPIIGGTVTTGDPAVVLLVSYPQDESALDTCTAALIAPTVLVTAAHCVDPGTHGGHSFGVFTGPDASAYADIAQLKPMLAKVKSLHVHPEYDTAPPFRADIAVVVLDQPLATAPLPINRAALSPALVGGEARIVGYGQVQYGKYNVIKHEATTVLASIGPVDTVVVGDLKHRSCIGDSGGPALVKIDGVETIVGVDSYAETSGCLEAASYRRTDVYTAFLDQYAPPPAPPVDGGLGGGGAGGSGSGSGGSSGEGGSGEGGSDGATTATSSSGGSEPSSSGCAVSSAPWSNSSASTSAALLAAAALWRRRRAARRRESVFDRRLRGSLTPSIPLSRR